MDRFERYKVQNELTSKFGSWLQALGERTARKRRLSFNSYVLKQLNEIESF
jgi:hypothetical protein